MDDNEETRPRGRPKNIDRSRVIEAAMLAWWRAGTDGVSLNEVVRQAGASKPAIYREFGGEDGLMEAALEYYSTNYLSMMLAMTEEEGSFAEVLDALIEFIIVPSGALPLGCLLAKMRVLSSDLGPQTQARVDAVREESRSRYRAWLQRARDAGEISDDVQIETGVAFLDTQLTSLLMQVALGERAETLRAQSRLTFAGLLAPG